MDNLDTIRLLEFVAFVFVLIWAVSFAIRSARKHENRQQRSGGTPKVTPRATSLNYQPPNRRDDVAEPADLDEHMRRFNATQDGPGRYRVRGVDRQSKSDRTWFCQADSKANAKVKGELEGMIVTDVELDAPSDRLPGMGTRRS